MIDLLKLNLNPVSDAHLQHALLGTLRNLAVNKDARIQLLDEGLLEPCMILAKRFNSALSQPVLFKLIQTIRLVIEGNTDAAVEVGGDRALLDQLVAWGATEPTGIKSEASRLLAGIIKNSFSTEVMSSVVDAGGLPAVTTMLMSSHNRMINEAMLTLTLLAGQMDSEV